MKKVLDSEKKYLKPLSNSIKFENLPKIRKMLKFCLLNYIKYVEQNDFMKINQRPNLKS